MSSFSVSSVEIYSKTILTRFETLKKAAAKVRQFRQLDGDLEVLESAYMLCSADIFCCNKSLIEFIQATNAINSGLIDIFKYAENLTLKLDRRAANEIRKILDQYPKSDMLVRLDKSNYSICFKCDVPMEIDQTRTSYYCAECGTLREMVGSIFEDTSQFGSTVKQKPNNKFSKNKHYEKWIRKILAQESDTVLNTKDYDSTELLRRIGEIVDRDHKMRKLLTINDIRDMLYELEQSKLYDHAALILSKISSISPPMLQQDYIDEAGFIFVLVLECSAQIRLDDVTDDNKNEKYYPYFIMKIFDCIIPESDAEARRVLYYVHIQQKATIEKNDVIWCLICSKMRHPKIIYKPTERDLNLSVHLY